MLRNVERSTNSDALEKEYTPVPVLRVRTSPRGVVSGQYS